MFVANFIGKGRLAGWWVMLGDDTGLCLWAVVRF